MIQQERRSAIVTGDSRGLGPNTVVSLARLCGLWAAQFDYFVNNASISYHNSLDKTTEAELDAIYRVNFKGVFFLPQRLLPLMKNDGRIVNLSSGLALVIVPGSVPTVHRRRRSRC